MTIAGQSPDCVPASAWIETDIDEDHLPKSMHHRDLKALRPVRQTQYLGDEPRRGS